MREKKTAARIIAPIPIRIGAESTPADRFLMLVFTKQNDFRRGKGVLFFAGRFSPSHFRRPVDPNRTILPGT
jgi:hypothetical protein